MAEAFTHNPAVIERFVGEQPPRYDVDAHGQPITEDTTDRRPYGSLSARTPSTALARSCMACGRKYPFKLLCGYCWHEVRKLQGGAVVAGVDGVSQVVLMGDAPGL